jgi:uncharacterized protein DUF6152
MKRSMVRRLAACAAISALGLSVGGRDASAHHSFALFDSSKSITLEGRVKQFDWTNPHSWIRLEVSAGNNQSEEWVIELPAAALLAREGWNKSYVKPGERILVRINPLKNGMKGGVLQSFRQDAAE